MVCILQTSDRKSLTDKKHVWPFTHQNSTINMSLHNNHFVLLSKAKLTKIVAHFAVSMCQAQIFNWNGYLVWNWACAAKSFKWTNFILVTWLIVHAKFNFNQQFWHHNNIFSFFAFFFLIFCIWHNTISAKHSMQNVKQSAQQNAKQSAKQTTKHNVTMIKNSTKQKESFSIQILHHMNVNILQTLCTNAMPILYEMQQNAILSSTKINEMFC